MKLEPYVVAKLEMHDTVSGKRQQRFLIQGFEAGHMRLFTITKLW